MAGRVRGAVCEPALQVTPTRLGGAAANAEALDPQVTDRAAVQENLTGRKACFPKTG